MSNNNSSFASKGSNNGMLRRLKRDREDRIQGGSKATKSRLLKLREQKVKPQLLRFRNNGVVIEDENNRADVLDSNNNIIEEECCCKRSKLYMLKLILGRICCFIWRYYSAFGFVIVLLLLWKYNMKVSQNLISYIQMMKEYSSERAVNSTLKTVKPYGNKLYRSNLDSNHDMLKELPPTLMNIVDVSVERNPMLDVILFWKIDNISAMIAERIFTNCFFETDSNKRILFTSLLHQEGLEKSSRKRMITLLIHPIENFYRTFQDLHVSKEISFEEYIKMSPSSSKNTITKSLIKKPYIETLNQQDLNLAKEILRRKCLVGLMSKFIESLTRFQRYFHLIMSPKKQSCLMLEIKHFKNVTDKFVKFDHGSKVYQMFVVHSFYDMQLYEFALDLFETQSKYF